MSTHPFVEHFFRHEFSRLVAWLACRFGYEHLEDIEDAAQSALLAALNHWSRTEPPADPSAWLARTAQNQLLSVLRSQRRQRHLLEDHAIDARRTIEVSDALATDDVADDLLRMLFVCCDGSLPDESQLSLALKVLCGFDVREIAFRLFTSEANVYKRQARARRRLQADGVSWLSLSADEYAARRSGVHRVLYVMFTEGYLSSHLEAALRGELCDEAIRLGEILAQHPVGQSPDTAALMALMYLHRSRMGARQNELGGLLLLEEQDRTQWDTPLMEQGFRWLASSASGEKFSRYHAEAGIAAEHCLAPSFAATRWDRVVDCYLLLEQQTRSPLHTLNRALAVAEWKSPQDGLAVVEQIEAPDWLKGSYLWSATLADLHRRCGHPAVAGDYRNRAIELAPSAQVKSLLRRRLQP